MGSLANRARKFYFLQGLKLFGYVSAVQLILVFEWIMFGTEEADMVGFVSQNFITFNAAFMVLFNMMFSIYGPNWYDSMVLSMGARRKDIFWGEIIKQVTYTTLTAALNIIVCIVFNHTNFLGYTFVAIATAMILGAGGLVIGYKIRKYGKIVIFGILMVIFILSGIVGGLMAIGKFTVISKLGSGLLLTAVGAVAVIVFILLELWAYKLNQKSMVN